MEKCQIHYIYDNFNQGDRKMHFTLQFYVTKDNLYTMKSLDVKNKLNTLFLILLAELLPFDLLFEIFLERLMLLIIV